jgi:hypothetical protein
LVGSSGIDFRGILDDHFSIFNRGWGAFNIDRAIQSAVKLYFNIPSKERLRFEADESFEPQANF